MYLGESGMRWGLAWGVSKWHVSELTFELFINALLSNLLGTLLYSIFFLSFFLSSFTQIQHKKKFFFLSFLPGHVISLAIQVNELAVIFCLFHNFYNTHSLVCQCLCTYNNNNNNNITNILMYLDLSIGRYLCSYRYTMWICDVRSLVQNR